jgi:hypothetical protein
MRNACDEGCATSTPIYMKIESGLLGGLEQSVEVIAKA